MSSSAHKANNPHTKHPQFGHLPLSTSGPQDVAITGSALLNTPYLNKGAAFPASERRDLKLTGLLPQNIQTLEQQLKRAYQQYSSRQDDLAKNTFMTSLAEQNQVLYFRVSLFIIFSYFESLLLLDTREVGYLSCQPYLPTSEQEMSISRDFHGYITWDCCKGRREG
jgi:hypothetical protein